VVTIPVLFISFMIHALFVIGVVAPGALSIPPNAIYLPKDFFLHETPDASIYQTIIEDSLQHKKILWPLPPGCTNCQYKLPFETMPMMLCHQTNSTTRTLAPGEVYPIYNGSVNIRNETQGILGLYQFLVDSSVYHSENNSLTTTSTACSLSTNYVVVTVQTRFFPENATWANIQLTMQLPIRANHRGDAIDQILSIMPSCSNTDVYVSWLACLLDQFADHFLGYLDSSGNTSRAPKAFPFVEDAMGYAESDYSGFSEDYFNYVFNDILMRYYVERGKATRSATEPITASETFDKWQYTPLRLWAPYTTALVVFFITGLYAAYCMKVNGGAMESGFSQFLGTTRNPNLDQACNSGFEEDDSSKVLLRYEREGVFRTNLEGSTSLETPQYVIPDKQEAVSTANATERDN
jgi:hypothetical protein